MVTFTRIGAKVKVDYGNGNGVNLEPSFNISYAADDPYIYITNATSGKDRSSNGLRVRITDITGRPNDTPEDVADWLRDNFFYKGGLSEYTGEFANYTDLTTTLPAGVSGRFAYVLASEGTKWLPGSLGGTFYGAGWYYDTGSAWSNKNDEIFEGLSETIPSNVVASSTQTLSGGSNNVIIDTSGVIISMNASPTSGDEVRINNDSGGNITLNGNGNNIYDSATQVLTDGESLFLLFGNNFLRRT